MDQQKQTRGSAVVHAATDGQLMLFDITNGYLPIRPELQFLNKKEAEGWLIRNGYSVVESR